MNEFLSSARRILDIELTRIGNTPVSLSTLATVLFIIVVTFWISRSLRLFVERFMSQRGGKLAATGTITALMHYAVLATGFGVALGTVGVDLSALFAAGAIFAVGIGFAMQNVVQNFVSGVILLTERTIKPGDVIEVEGKIVTVLETGIRSAVAQTRDGEALIIPNSTLIQSTVMNYMLREDAIRIRAAVGVSYGSDMKAVREILTGVANDLSAAWGVKGKTPQVVMTEFGSNSVNWEVAVWMDKPWEMRPALSELNEAIWWAFKRHDIVIAFPQLDVHFDESVTDRFNRAEVA